MKITALAPWYGSKRTLAPRILAELGEHSVYWEPFCGSLAILLAKEPCRQETVNDLLGDLVNLARVVADPAAAPMLDWRLRRTLVSEALYRESIERLRGVLEPQADWAREAKVDRAYWYFVRSWMGMNGVAGTKCHSNFARRFTSNGGCPAVRFAAAVDSIPAWHARLRTVAIYQGCGIEICEKVEDKAGTVLYVDPPYLVKSDEYVHDFASADHQRLAAALVRLKQTRVVVSYYEHMDLATLYPGWRKVALAFKKAMGNAQRSPGKVAPEVLLVNGEPIPEPAKAA